MRNLKNILITGGAGFIGSHVVRRFVNNYPDSKIVNLDKLTYAGNLENLTDIEKKPNYTFVKGDIVDSTFIDELFKKHQFDGVSTPGSRIACGQVYHPPYRICHDQCNRHYQPVECSKKYLGGKL